MRINKDAKSIIEQLKKQGFSAYLVGGSIRDLLLKTPPHEWDITTSATPDQVTALFDKVIPTGIDYGTVTVMIGDLPFEVTTFRADEKYVDGRHPSNVNFTDDIHQDLSRRDFTINALAYDPIAKELIDDFSGQKDLKAKVIRTVGSPIERFSEDGLRSVRACRFAAKLDFKIEKKTLAAISQTLDVTKKVAPERIHDELVKMLTSKKPSIGFKLMQQSGLLQLILPELLSGEKVEQPAEFHKYDVLDHNLAACDAAPADNLIVRLAALLHDVAKPKCKVDMHFYGHDSEGTKLAEQILKRLKFSNNDTKQVTNLIANHMFNYTQDWSDAAVRRFIRRAGSPANIAALFALRQADVAAMKSNLGTKYLGELQKRIDKIIAEQNALHTTDLKINGNDLMKALSLKPGPKVGQILEALLEKVLDDPKLNEKETLLKLANTIN